MNNKHECSHLVYWIEKPAVNAAQSGVHLCQIICISISWQLPYQISAWIFKISIFNGQKGQEGGTATLCQILSKSLQPRPRYGDFSIFQDGGRRHVGFLIFQIFNGQKGQEGRITSVCQISSKSLELRLVFNIAIFVLKGDVKLQLTNLNCGRNMVIFRFLRWRPPPYGIFKIWTF